MSLKPEFGTYSYVGRMARFRTQSIVECRLTGVGEISSVLASRASAVLTAAEVTDGEVQYRGKVLFCIVYEGADKNVCRLERGAEFSHRGENALAAPACVPRVELSVLSTSVRKEGSSFFISCVVEADISLCGVKNVDYLAGGEGLICQREKSRVLHEETVTGEMEVEDEFETDLVSDVLMHGETVGALRASCETGFVTVEGEVGVNICATKGEGPDNYERLLPFKAEIPCDFSTVSSTCRARVSVTESNVTVRYDEDKGRSVLALSVRLSVFAVCQSEEEIDCASDAFCCDCEVKTEEGEEVFERLSDVVRFTERVSGVAALSDAIDFTATLQALVCQRAEAEIACLEGKEEVQGVVSATLLVCDADGTHRGIPLQLPFAVPLRTEGAGRKEVNALVCGMSVRQKREGEAEVEATLKITVEIYEERRFRYLSQVTEGEKIETATGAFGVFVPREGDGLWEIAKSLHRPPEEVEAGNPDLTFPVKKGERIIVYRRKERKSL